MGWLLQSKAMMRAKANEIIKLIESKLDVKTEGVDKKEVVNIETKKTVKK